MRERTKAKYDLEENKIGSKKIYKHQFEYNTQ